MKLQESLIVRLLPKSVVVSVLVEIIGASCERVTNLL